MKKILLMIVLAIALFGITSWFLNTPVYAELIPALKAIPAGLPADVQKKLSDWKAKLEKELRDFQDGAKIFNDKPAEEQTDAEYEALQATRDRYVNSAKSFNEEVAVAVRSLKIPKKETIYTTKPGLAPADVRVIKGINALAKQLGWSEDERDRLNRALNDLVFDIYPNLDGAQIRRTWQVVLARGQDADLMREAFPGGGSGFSSGAGKQTVNKDCVIFALANAAGLPYGLVAARATELIRQGSWREAGERADPQKFIEQEGLNGGEVVLLAEVFGRAEVVSISGLAETLKAGRPVLVNVVPPNNTDIRFGHEVVLTNTFQHGGETWYAMMDSSQGPQQWLFLSKKELETMLKENGVAYLPEPGTTPQLLREEGNQ